jgi:Ca2+-binding RTX toxin-like protein
LTGGSGNDWLEGNGADNILQGGGGQDHLDGGNGSDTADFTDRNFISWLVDLDIGTATATNGGSGTDWLTGIENVATGGGSDTIYGDENVNALLGGDGNDTLDGRGGTDALDGGAGNDTFLYRLGNGTDIISNFVTGVGSEDRIDVREIISIHSIGDILARTTQLSATSVRIAFSASDTLTLQNVNWGIVSADDFVFAPASDTTAPRLTATGPRDNDTGVVIDSNIGLIFDEAVQRGSGDINIFNANGTLFRRIAITDTSQAIFSGASVTINPGIDFAAGADYYVTMGSGVIRDLAGNAFQGLFSGELNFTTASGSTPPPPNDPVYVQVLDNSIVENAGGNLTTLSFGVVLTGPGAGTRDVYVQYATEDIVGSSGRAFAGVDYVAASGTLLIPAGQTTGAIDVTLIGDTVLEPHEVFRLNLSLPYPGVTLLNNFATGTILNDDAAPNLIPITQTDLAIIEPNAQAVIDVLANDSDPDGDYPLQVTQIGYQSGSATITVGPGGANVLFTPSPGFTGVINFIYTMSDAEGALRNGFANVIVAGDGTPGVSRSGAEGDDILAGLGGNDTLSGGLGDDVIMGGPGADRIDGGPGFDWLDLRQAAHGATFEITDAWVWDDGDGGQDILQNVEGILGTAFNDFIDGRSDTASHVFTNYRFYGNDGNDTIRSQDGDDYLEGGPGNDELWFEAGRDVVFGGLGSDRILANNAPSDTLPDWLDGGPGDDFIWATGGWENGGSADSLFGGEGHDDFTFWTGDTVSGGTGRDLFGFFGATSATAQHAWITDLEPGEKIRFEFQTPVIIDFVAYWYFGPIAPGSGDSTQLNHIEFATGNGETTLYFGYDSTPGADFVLHLAGDFELDQFQVDDPSGLTRSLAILVQGGSGDDTLIGGPGNNPLDGSAGTDTIDYSWAMQSIIVDLSLTQDQATGAEIGTDQLTDIENVIGGQGADALTGDAVANRLAGGNGGDIVAGGAGNDILDGGTGTDTADYSEATGTGVTVNLTLAGAQLISAMQGSDTLSGIENITGSALGDTLTGNASANVIDGRGGIDTMAGAGGGDTYVADSQSDIIVEQLNQGTDVVQTAVLNYSLFAIANVERILFIGAGNFVGRGNGLDNRIQGASGNDRFVVDQGGADRYFGEVGVADTMDYRTSATGAIVNLTTGVHSGAATGDFFSSIEYFFGSNTAGDNFTGAGFNDRLDGYGGADTLSGLGGNDTIMGGDGDDEISGGALLDFLHGNTGADDFNYTALTDSGPTSAARDRIYDFVAGTDDIDVSAIDASAAGAGNDAFTGFLGSGAFTAEGQVRWFQSGANTMIEFNTTGTSGAEMQIQLQNFTAANLTAADFIA